MGWRDFQESYPMEKMEKKEFITPKDEFIPLIPFIPESGSSKKSSRELDIADPETKKKPQLHLLTEIELEAFNGWYATCRKPKFNLSHEEATHKAWQLLIESLQVMRMEKRGRYSPEN